MGDGFCKECDAEVVAMGEYGPVCANGHDGIPPETARRLDHDTGAMSDDEFLRDCGWVATDAHWLLPTADTDYRFTTSEALEVEHAVVGAEHYRVSEAEKYAAQHKGGC